MADSPDPLFAAQVIAVLRSYNVCSHYLANKAGTVRRYAVFKAGAQIGDPMAHREAQELREQLIATDLAEIFAVSVKSARQEGIRRLG